MLKFYKKIKFENLVIIGGIIECILLLIALFTRYEIPLETGIAIQIFIVIYIIKRLFRIIQQEIYGSQFPYYKM
jgi:hypothetical protein